MNRTTRKLTYTAIAVLVLSLSMTPMLSLAAADQPDLQRRVAIRGIGFAIDTSTNEMHRSGFRLLGLADLPQPEGSDSVRNLDIVRGGIAILDNDTRIVYTFVNGTWSGTVSKEGFVASGAVQDADGNQYRAHLKGDVIKHPRRGAAMLVRGELTGDNTSYDLLYFATLVNGHPQKPRPQQDIE